jgi:hypothetical protein
MVFEFASSRVVSYDCTSRKACCHYVEKMLKEIQLSFTDKVIISKTKKKRYGTICICAQTQESTLKSH